MIQHPESDSRCLWHLWIWLPVKVTPPSVTSGVNDICEWTPGVNDTPSLNRRCRWQLVSTTPPSQLQSPVRLPVSLAPPSPNPGVLEYFRDRLQVLMTLLSTQMPMTLSSPSPLWCPTWYQSGSWVAQLNVADIFFCKSGIIMYIVIKGRKSSEIVGKMWKAFG